MILPVLDPLVGIVVGMGFVMAVCLDIMGAPLIGVNQGCAACGSKLRSNPYRPSKYATDYNPPGGAAPRGQQATMAKTIGDRGRRKDAYGLTFRTAVAAPLKASPAVFHHDDVGRQELRDGLSACWPGTIAQCLGLT
jgi:hypothetical protein